jgi:DNA-binding NarL/FixJ family response regulator
MPSKVLLVDDNAIVRLRLYSLLKKQSDIEVVGGVEDGRQAVDAVQALAPDLVVKNISMPDLSSLNTTHKTVEKLNNVRVIALSIHSSRKYIAKILKGAIRTRAFEPFLV